MVSTRSRSTIIDAVEKLIGPETAAILLEPVQGEGGIRPFPTASLKRLRELCDKHGLLLIFDEVQCGVGRTGKLFAHEWSGVTPDIMAIAKGIGGGFPVGACLATDNAAHGHDRRRARHHLWRQSARHGRGQRGAGRRAGRRFPRRGRRRKSLLMKQGLAAVADEFPDVIEDVRGSGLMLGLKCRAPNGPDQHGAARPEAALGAGGRQCRAPAAAAGRFR
jgi:acetylornithine/N-succinyldiaminopimelate aminotransferase